MKLVLILLILILLLCLPLLNPRICYSASSQFSNCKVKDLELSENDFRVALSVYTDGQEQKKSVFIMPPTGGKNFIDESYARSLCKAGFTAYIFDSWTEPIQNIELEVHQRNYENAQRAIGITLAHIPGQYVGILGTSVGGLYTATAMSYHKQFNAGFLITWGAPIALVIANSDQDAMVNLKSARFEKFKFKSQTEYESALLKKIELDPFLLPKNFVDKDLGMAISSNDHTVSTRLQEKLKVLWNPRTVIYVSGDHKVAIIKTWLLYSKDIVEFFENSYKSSKISIETKHNENS